MSSRRGPEALAGTVRSLGANARAGTVQEAATQDIVVLAVRWEQAREALAGVSDWHGRVLVDATNRPPSEDTGGRGSSEIIASYAPGASVIKALNTLVVKWIPEQLDPQKKLVLFMSGDDRAAKQKLAQLLEDGGFSAVDLGGLAESGGLQEFGAPLSGLHVELVKRMKA